MQAEARDTFLSQVRSCGLRAAGLLDGVSLNSTATATAVGRMCSTLAELFMAVIAVLESEAPGQAMTLARSMLEAEVDLFALKNDPDYLKQMRLKAQVEIVAMYEAFASKATEPVSPELSETLQAAKEQVAKLKAEGIKEARISQRFERAGRGDDYKSTYAFLCSSAHNDLFALTWRHSRDNDQTTLFNDVSATELRAVCGICLGLLLRGISVLPHFSNLDPGKVKNESDAIDRAWVNYSDAFLKAMI